MLAKNQSSYSIARFDGALMYDDVRAGLMITGITKSPIVQFRIKAGAQYHPAWAIDEIAIEIYSYCQVDVSFPDRVRRWHLLFPRRLLPMTPMTSTGTTAFLRRFQESTTEGSPRRQPTTEN